MIDLTEAESRAAIAALERIRTLVVEGRQPEQPREKALPPMSLLDAFHSASGMPGNADAWVVLGPIAREAGFLGAFALADCGHRDDWTTALDLAITRLRAKAESAVAT